MFWHVFHYSLKADLRDRALVFWTLAFPLILATLFGMAFANLNQTEAFNRIPVAVVDNAAWQADSSLRTVMQEVSAGDNALFSLRILPENEALAALRENKVTGVLTARSVTAAQTAQSGQSGQAGQAGPTTQSGQPAAMALPPVTALDVTVTQTGLSPSIIKVFADEYMQTAANWRSILTLDPAVDLAALQQTATREWLTSRPLSQANPNTILVYFYALIAMTCLYGGFWGMKEVMEVQADQSGQAVRIVVSPVSRLKLILASSAAKMVIHFSSILILLAYLQFGLHIGFGQDLGRIVLAAFVGSVLGLAMGAVIGAAVHVGEGAKTGILIGFTMLCSMFAGLNNAEMKYITIKNLPAMAWINPANLIGDSFYALYYFDTHTRYWSNILVMLVFIAACGTFVALKLRRQRYASL